MFTEREVIAAHLDFDGVAERREADKFNQRAHQQTHFEQTAAVFGRDIDFGDGGGGADRE